ncbi:hypothetical protein CN918_25940 [Priestia megaterium]|nr:hypothetical protein CN918_25940 [Priestia megaterium]
MTFNRGVTMKLRKGIISGVLIGSLLLAPVGANATQAHQVKDGETLWKISQTYGVSTSNLKKWNQLSSNLIYAGQILQVNQTNSVNSKTLTGQVSAGFLNVREEPTITASLVTVLKKGETVDIKQTQGDWMLVTSNKVEGWVSKQYVTMNNLIDTKKLPTPTVYVSANELNVRAQANTQTSIKGTIKKGTAAKVLDEKGDWTLISTNTTKGWVMTQYLSNSYPTNIHKTKTILLDAGHGGNDPGAVGYDGTREKDLTLQLALKVQRQLIEKGYKVEMIRTDDSSCNNLTNVSKELRCRVQQSKSTGADIYVSIHINSSLNGQGTETYYNLSNPYPMESKRLAQSIHNHYQPIFNSINRGVKTENYYVIKHNTIPSTLLEIGFITNIFDLPKMKDSEKQSEVAAGIASGIDEYFKN